MCESLLLAQVVFIAHIEHGSIIVLWCIRQYGEIMATIIQKNGILDIVVAFFCIGIQIVQDARRPFKLGAIGSD